MSDRLGRAQLARAATRLGQNGLLPLMLMTDDARLDDPLMSAANLPRGSMVIVRARGAVPREILAKAMLKLARRKGLVILIAADPLLVARIGADGIHLPEARAKEAVHWRAHFPDILITSTAHSLRALMLAQQRPIDAVILSPVFATQSHPGGKTLTAIRANLIAEAMRKPVYALGGIDAQNARLLSKHAFSGIAAIGALAV